MNKILILFCLILFIPISYAQEDDNLIAIDQQGISEECRVSLENLNNEVDISLYNSLYSNCFKEIYVDNTSSKIGYFIFGEEYLESLKFSTMPFNFLISTMEYIINDRGEFSEEEVSTFISNTNSIIDEVKSEYNHSDNIFLNGSVSSIIKSISFFLNSLISVFIGVLFVKSTWDFQRGNFEESKNFSTTVIRTLGGIGLLAPFIGGYSLLQFIFMAALGFSVSLATLVFILIYVSFFNIEVEELQYSNIENNNTMYEVVSDSVINLYKNSIISNMCLIKETEKMISDNVSDYSLVEFNRDHLEDNFIKCLAENKGGELVANLTTENNVLNYCINNHNHYYQRSGQRIEMNITPVNCGEYMNKETSIINQIRNLVEERSKSMAISLHKKDCEFNNEYGQASGVIDFNCVDLEDIGDFSFNLNGSPDIIEWNSNIEDLNEELYNVFEQDNQTLYQQLVNLNSLIDLSIIENVFEEDGVSSEISINVEKIINNGWLFGFSIFMPNNLVGQANKILNTDEFLEEKTNSLSQITNNQINVDMILNNPNHSFSSAQRFYTLINGFEYENGLMSSEEQVEKFSLLEMIIPNIFGEEEGSHRDKFKECVIGRDTANCSFNPSSIFISNPISGFYYQINSFGDYIIAIYLSSMAVEKITENGTPQNTAATFVFGVAAILMALYLLGTVIMIFAPFFIFISAIIEWIYKIIKTPIYLHLFVFWYIIPDKGEDIMGSKEEEKRVYRLLGETILTPLFIIIGLLVSFSVLIISYLIMSIVSFIVFSFILPQTSNILVNMIYVLGSYGVFLFFSGYMVFACSKKMLEVVHLINSYFGFDQFDDQNLFEQIMKRIRDKMWL